MQRYSILYQMLLFDTIHRVIVAIAFCLTSSVALHFCNFNLNRNVLIKFSNPKRKFLNCTSIWSTIIMKIALTRSTQRAQTSLAEADHYSHIAHCKMLILGCERLPTHLKKKKKVLDHYLHHDLGMLPLLRCIFAHLLILQYPDHHQNLISSSLYY